MDLLAVVVASLVLVPSALFATGVLQIVLGLPYLLFFPGYTLIAALFPRKGSLGGVERIALSFGLSIAVVPLIGLILNYTPWGIRLVPILVSNTAFILAMSGIAWYRRRNLSKDERFEPSLRIGFPSWQGQTALDKGLSVALVLAIVAAVGTLGYVIATPKVGEKFTEFYILGPGGQAAGYQTDFTLGEKGEVILGIVNHEQANTSYQVKVMLDSTAQDVQTWLGDKDGGSTLLPDNILDVGVLPSEEKWEGKLLYEPLMRGVDQKLEFLLFSSKLRGDHHIRGELDDGAFVSIKINEASGKGEVSVTNSTSSQTYRLEVWQEESIQKAIEFWTSTGEELENEFEFPPGKSTFLLYQGGALVLQDEGEYLSLHLWINVH